MDIFRANGLEFVTLLQFYTDSTCSKISSFLLNLQWDKYVKHLTCWNQFLAMMFGQLSNRESLRDLIVALEAHLPFGYGQECIKIISRTS